MAKKSFTPGEIEVKSRGLKAVFGTTRSKKGFFIICFVMILFALFIAAYVMTKKHTAAKDITARRLSYIPIENSINPKVNPCDNFYEFACGSWKNDETTDTSTFEILQHLINKRAVAIIDSSTVSPEYPRMVNNALNFYNKCIEIDKFSNNTIGFLNNFLEPVGGWPFLANTFTVDSFDWIEATAYLVKFGISTFVDVHTMVDLNNSSLNVLYLRPVSAEEENPFNAFMLFAIAESVNFWLNDSEIVDLVNNFTDVLESWNSLFINCSGDDAQTQTTIGELGKLIPGLDWLRFLQLVTNETLLEIGTTISEKDTILISDSECLKGIVHSLNTKNFSYTDLANIFGWAVVRDVAFLIPGVFRHYDPEITIEELDYLVKKKCFDYTIEVYEKSVDFLYVHHSNQSSFSIVDEIEERIVDAFETAMNDSTWLDSTTKAAALDKLRSMQVIIGSDYFLANQSAFEELHADFQLHATNLLEEFLTVKSYKISKRLLDLKSFNSPSPVQVYRSITHVSAYYNPQINVLVYPLALQNPPFLFEDGPRYLNFGASGSIIGHEIMHGFDGQGYKRGSAGSIKKWWSKSSNTSLHKQFDCFKRQYSDYYRHEFAENETLSSLNENIADSEGLRLAYFAYKNWADNNTRELRYPALQRYTPEQMFFLAYASIWCSSSNKGIVLRKEHSANEFRVNAPLQNLESFSKIFGCRSEARMNPVNKCSVW